MGFYSTNKRKERTTACCFCKRDENLPFWKDLPSLRMFPCFQLAPFALSAHGTVEDWDQSPVQEWEGWTHFHTSVWLGHSLLGRGNGTWELDGQPHISVTFMVQCSSKVSTVLAEREYLSDGCLGVDCACEGEPRASKTPFLREFFHKTSPELQLPPKLLTIPAITPPLIGLLTVWCLKFQSQPCLLSLLSLDIVGHLALVIFFLAVIILQNFHEYFIYFPAPMDLTGLGLWGNE